MSTTDPQHERFDLYDALGRPLGVSKPRGEVHRDGDWHRSLHLWVWGVEESEPFVLFQRRSMTKDTWPGALDVTVGGHFRSGETLAETLREAEEEVGLPLREEDVVRIGRRFFVWRTDSYVDSEIAEVYAARCDQPLSAYRLHPEEVDGLVRISVADGLRLFGGDASTITGLEFVRDGSETETVDLSLEAFVDASDGYAVRALEAIIRLQNGEAMRPFTIRPAQRG